jgi:DNA-binding NarL/FixJ family response regulator
LSLRTGLPADGGRLCAACRGRRSRRTHEHSYRQITLRETQIVRLVGPAKSNKDIAGELRLTEGTIKEHLNRVFRKVEVKNPSSLRSGFTRTCGRTCRAAVPD